MGKLQNLGDCFGCDGESYWKTILTVALCLVLASQERGQYAIATSDDAGQQGQEGECFLTSSVCEASLTANSFIQSASICCCCLGAGRPSASDLDVDGGHRFTCMVVWERAGVLAAGVFG